MIRRCAVLAFALCLLYAPTASAHIIGSPASAKSAHALKSRLAKPAVTVQVPLADGSGALTVDFTAVAASQKQLAQDYVTFIEALPHGAELTKLRLLIAAFGEVERLCGGQPGDGTFACYDGNLNQMIVPAASLDTPSDDGSGYTVAYALTHEYGHHIARHRSNPGLKGGSDDYGPKFWSSYELACLKADDGRAFPGDEEDNYWDNPAENWAETYARIAGFPDTPWSFSEHFVPDAGALEAARRDVLAPWTHNLTATFDLIPGRHSQTFTLPVTLDGAITVKARGARHSTLSVAVSADGEQLGTTDKRPGRSSGVIQPACRANPTETYRFTVRRSGNVTRPARLTVSFPG